MSELLLSCQELTCSFGGPPLFEGLSFGISEGDHVGLVGPNGSGKTTLLRILAGLEPPTSGLRSARKRLRVGYVAQAPGFGPEATVGAVLSEAAAAAAPDLEPHEIEARAAVATGRGGFADPAEPVASLSGGWKKRLAIARELARRPELLLLDEPTNHLDVDGILWLEELLRREPEAFVAVSHDRYFLEAAARRVIELDRIHPGGILDVGGRYSRFLEEKDELLQGRASYRESLRNRVRGELEWLSRKARARTRKAKARVDEAARLQEELGDLDERASRREVAIDFAATGRRTRRLLVARGLGRRFGQRAIVSDLDLVLGPGHRLGLLGPNGSGKTTLLRLLAGLDPPDAGELEHAPGLRVVVFDQHRSRLDPALSLRRSLAPAGDSVVFGERAVHVAAWAQRFLFRSDQLETPVGQLSGGEQARVLIAKLMLEPADLLLLDEPTNDLDIGTLEVLEESLLEFPGALVLVTHDRYLLDRVSNRLIALDGRGGATFFADYPQWEAERRAGAERPSGAPKPESPPKRQRTAPRGEKRLSWRERREWEEMEERILAAEAAAEAREREAADPAIATDHAALRERAAALAEAQAEVERLYARWAELEARVTG